MIDRHTRVPLYCQLRAVILERIENGEFKPNDPIPSEAELTRQYGLSRTTVRQAINELVREGHIYRLQGKGTFVSRPKMQHGLRKLTSFSEDMLSRGLRPASQVLEFGRVAPSSKVASMLEMPEGEEVYRIVRLRLADDEPVGLQESHVRVAHEQKIAREDISGEGSLYRLLESRFNMQVNEADESVEATLADAHEAELLQVRKGAPLLLRERITYVLGGKPVEFVKTLYRADRYRYLIHLTRD
jgi:GntR family transcriptional regulator